MRFGVHDDHTRIVLDLSQRVDFKTLLLSDPYRLALDLPEMQWELGSKPGESGIKGAGLVSHYRFGGLQPGQSRLVFDLKVPVHIRKAFLLPPQEGKGPRLVIDIEEVSRQAYKASAEGPILDDAGPENPPHETKAAAPTAEPAAKAENEPKVSAVPGGASSGAGAPRGEKPLIMLDPGHGGIDPGAMGRSKTPEKIITLEMARTLRTVLEKSGKYRVALTRETDTFLRLRERIKIARDAGASLFISLHADSISDPTIRGLSVYTLSETASDSEAESLAQSENKVDLIAGVDLSAESQEVTNILIDLAQRETMNFSAHFASFLVQDFARKTTLLRKTHRFAGFAVLKAPDVPSVLVELGYLSNKNEERQLRDPSYRANLAEAIAKSVDRYFEWKVRLARS